MEVITKRPIPIYEAECHECKSIIHYKAVETSYGFITCPVCGVAVQALALLPINRQEIEENQKNK